MPEIHLPYNTLEELPIPESAAERVALLIRRKKKRQSRRHKGGESPRRPPKANSPARACNSTIRETQESKPVEGEATHRINVPQLRHQQTAQPSTPDPKKDLHGPTDSTMCIANIYMSGNAKPGSRMKYKKYQRQLTDKFSADKHSYTDACVEDPDDDQDKTRLSFPSDFVTINAKRNMQGLGKSLKDHETQSSKTKRLARPLGVEGKLSMASHNLRRNRSPTKSISADSRLARREQRLKPF